MTLAIFPKLRGLNFDLQMTPSFKTGIATSVSGGETRTPFQQFPIWLYTLSYEWLPNRKHGMNDLEQIVGFFIARKANYEAFLYEAPETPIEEAELGIGDGTQTDFDLVRTIYGITEPAGGVLVKEDIQVYQNSILVPYDDFSLSDHRTVVFDTAPADEDIITACYKPLMRVRFEEDNTAFSQFYSRLWELQELGLRSVLV